MPNDSNEVKEYLKTNYKNSGIKLHVIHTVDHMGDLTQSFATPDRL